MTAPPIHPKRPSERVQPAFEVYGEGPLAPLLFTCEHASSRIPAPLRTTPADRFWLESHWGYDIGARTVVRELVRRMSATAVLARFSRLVCDPNRPETHSDLIRTSVEGQPLSFNRHLSPDELRRRIERYHRPYHQAVEDTLSDKLCAGRDVLLISMHSFTPVWNQRVRDMDIGLLYTQHGGVAARLDQQLRRLGFITAHNQPYSALDGLAYAVERHGLAHAVVFLEIEVNQSLICTPARARRFAVQFATALDKTPLRRHGR